MSDASSVTAADPRRTALLSVTAPLVTMLIDPSESIRVVSVGWHAGFASQAPIVIGSPPTDGRTAGLALETASTAIGVTGLPGTTFSKTCPGWTGAGPSPTVSMTDPGSSVTGPSRTTCAARSTAPSRRITPPPALKPVIPLVVAFYGHRTAADEDARGADGVQLRGAGGKCR